MSWHARRPHIFWVKPTKICPNFTNGEVSSHKTSLTLILLIEVHAPSQESERSCICVLDVSIFISLSAISILNYGTVRTVWYVLFLMLFKRPYTFIDITTTCTCTLQKHGQLILVVNWLFVCLMVFNATFNNISAISWRCR